ncbi:MAG: hypothetical protein HC769_28925, partial [Cyanobacteria bacterium CRU_2_1]|nr:hypothetical protein [Cyanobacteria bacterium CRU_2_1]
MDTVEHQETTQAIREPEADTLNDADSDDADSDDADSDDADGLPELSGTVSDLIQDLLRLADDASSPLMAQLPHSPIPSYDDLLEQDPFLEVEYEDEITIQPEEEFFTTEDLIPDVTVPDDRPAPEPISSIWYLGIDFGTTGLSAVLLNRVTRQLYPLYWTETQDSPDAKATDRRFRLPTAVSFIPAKSDRSMPTQAEPTQRWITPVAIANLPSLIPPNASPDAPHPFLQDFKPFLKLAIPHYSSQTSQWEPVLQWSNWLQVPLIWIQYALQTLLTSLDPSDSSTGLTCHALGLEDPEFQTAFSQLTGVMMGHPLTWSDTYRFNLREAVLNARLVAQPEQIFLIEEAIATLLSVLRSNQEPTRQHDQSDDNDLPTPSSPDPLIPPT